MTGTLPDGIKKLGDPVTFLMSIKMPLSQTLKILI